jgi:hypothetical protein
MEEQLNPNPWLRNHEKLRACPASIKSGHGVFWEMGVELA